MSSPIRINESRSTTGFEHTDSDHADFLRRDSVRVCLFHSRPDRLQGTIGFDPDTHVFAFGGFVEESQGLFCSDCTENFDRLTEGSAFRRWRKVLEQHVFSQGPKLLQLLRNFRPTERVFQLLNQRY